LRKLLLPCAGHTRMTHDRTARAGVEREPAPNVAGPRGDACFSGEGPSRDGGLAGEPGEMWPRGSPRKKA
jgi:hypothetical protein